MEHDIRFRPRLQPVLTTRVRGKDKSDRATSEQVLDPRTRMILFKLLDRQVVSEVHGCISTGKEANVYHAQTRTGRDRAIKVGDARARARAISP